jgi:hypothetical protein
LKYVLRDFSRIFQEYFPKTVTKAIKKQASVAHVILFAPLYIKNKVMGSNEKPSP